MFAIGLTHRMLGRHVRVLGGLWVGLAGVSQGAVPAAPTNCVAVAYNPVSSTATIDIEWNDNSTDETNWIVQYSLNGGAFTNLGQPSSTTGSSTGNYSIQLTGASRDAVYAFRVYASNIDGVSAPTNEVTVGTADLGSPIHLSVTAVDPFNVVMSWDEQSTAETGFAIERKIGGEPWVYVGKTGANQVVVLPSNLIAPLGSYAFRVRAFQGGVPLTPDSAVGASAVSGYSNEVIVPGGEYPLSAVAVPGQTMINLSWANVQNEAGYDVLYLPSDGSHGANYELLGSLRADATSCQIVAPSVEAGKTYSFIVKPYDRLAPIGQSTVATVTVDGVTSKTGSSGTPGSSFYHVFSQASSAGVSSRVLTGVPSGLLFDRATGVLSGVYPAVGNYTLTYTVNLTNGGSVSQTFYIRVRPPAGPPTVGASIAAWTGTAGTTRDTPMAGAFSDVEAESAVRVSTTLGNMDFVLFNSSTPATVANFLSYVTAGKYTDVDFHRSIAGFVIQGGGIKGTGTGNQFATVATNPPVTNEPGIANERGTVSMAKLGGDPNSATSQFFVSLADNRSNLDYQNGGFTVLGRVAGNGMAVADEISALPINTYNLQLDGSATATQYTGFPLTSASTTMDQTRLVKMTSVTVIPTLSYSITGNTNPAVATATLVNGQLHLVGLAGGQTSVTVTATDLDNLTASQTVVVNLTDTYASWAARTTFPGGTSGVAQNPDGDGWNNLQEFAFLGDPALATATDRVVFGGVVGVAPAARYQTLTFPVRKATLGLTYAVEANNHLTGSWSEIWKSADGLGHAQVLSAVDWVDRTVVTVKDTAVMSGQGRRFLRVRVEQE